MSKGVLYIRYSSHSQNEQTVETQRDICTEYAKKNNIQIVNEYIDVARTGTNDKRENFQRMIEDSKKKLFDYIITYKVDRFARDKYDNAIYKRDLKKIGIRVLSAVENITDDPEGEMMEGFLETMAHYYSRNLSRNIKDGLATNAKKGLSIGGKSLPLGYKSIETTREIIIDKTTSPIVVKIFEMYRDNNSYAEIIRYLNLHNLKTSRGNEFNKNSIKRLLKNEKYIGLYRFRGEIVSESIPPIIDKELFYEVQDILEKRKKAPSRGRAKNEYLLTTKLFCGECGEMMTGFSGTSKTERLYTYYACKNSKIKQCDKKVINKDVIEDYVISKTRNLLDNSNINEIAKNIVETLNKSKDVAETKRLKTELSRNNKGRKNLFDSLKICKSDALKEEIMEELSRMEKQNKEIQNQLIYEEINLLELTVHDIVQFLKDLKKGRINDNLYRKMLIDVFVNKIYLYEDGRIMLLFTTQANPCEDKIPPLNWLESSFGSNIAPPSGYKTNFQFDFE